MDTIDENKKPIMIVLCILFWLCLCCVVCMLIAILIGLAVGLTRDHTHYVAVPGTYSSSPSASPADIILRLAIPGSNPATDSDSLAAALGLRSDQVSNFPPGSTTPSPTEFFLTGVTLEQFNFLRDSRNWVPNFNTRTGYNVDPDNVYLRYYVPDSIAASNSVSVTSSRSLSPSTGATVSGSTSFIPASSGASGSASGLPTVSPAISGSFVLPSFGFPSFFFSSTPTASLSFGASPSTSTSSSASPSASSSGSASPSFDNSASTTSSSSASPTASLSVGASASQSPSASVSESNAALPTILVLLSSPPVLRRAI